MGGRFRIFDARIPYSSKAFKTKPTFVRSVDITDYDMHSRFRFLGPSLFMVTITVITRYFFHIFWSQIDSNNFCTYFFYVYQFIVSTFFLLL